jgi:hypothetical protein
MKKTREALRRPLLSTAVGLLLVGQVAICQNALADGGDFSMDFTAAAPLTYNHSTGGGAYNDRTVGRDQDIVESLEGGDFACGDTVTFLTQITVDEAAAGAQTIRLRFEFTAHSTGQQGTALVDNVAGVSAAINGSAIDSGTDDDGGSTATPLDESVNGTVFVKPTTFFRSVDVTDLEGGETVVVRTDVAIVCNGQSPTGNMQARLASASVVAPVADTISVGDQTIPFKRVGDIKTCDPKVCEPPK